ncbi:Rap1a/Tai family immunity protein [Xanthobacter sp. V4C-4]|uniref:Rap1a/Tai family immunity protein n=1 Tax=Xanthobacter cornucopiae TaxID=3119924 RepID=UPI00372CB9AA
MEGVRIAALSLGVVAQLAAASAEDAAGPRPHLGVWEDVITAPLQEGPYGTGSTSTQRMVERCTAFEWSVKTDEAEEITKYTQNYQSGYCLGWINSALAFLNFHNETGQHTLGVCLPDGITSRQVVDLFLTYVHDNPDDLKYNPSLLIYWSLLDAYPCKSVPR